MTGRTRKPLFLRLWINFGAALVVSFGLVAIVTILPLKRALEQEVEADLQDAADDTLRSVRQLFRNRCDELRLWASLPMLDRTSGTLKRLGDGTNGDWLELMTVDGAGRVLASSRPGPVAGLIDLGDAATVQGLAPEAADCALVLRPGGRPAFTLAHAMPPGSGAAALVGWGDWRTVEEIVGSASLERVAQSPEAFLLLVSSDGAVLAGSEPGFADASEIVRDSQDGPDGISRTRLASGRELLRARSAAMGAWAGAPMLRLLALRDARAAHAELDRRLSRILLAALLGLLLAACLCSFVAQDLTRRLGRVIEGTERLAAGDLSIRLADDRKDEVGTLARSFDLLAAEVGRVHSRLKNEAVGRAEELERKTEELNLALRESRSAERAKSEFLANVSHEIRTPLNGIIGLTGLALDSEISPEVRGHLGLVKNAADSLLDLVNDILDFSKIDMRRLTLYPTPFRLRSGLDDLVRSLSERAVKKGLLLDHRVDERVPDDLVGDPGRLRQVLVSLIGNGLKFTEQGGVELKVSIERQEEDAVTLRFTVRDTGIGIPQEKQQAIFEPFTQADGSSTRRYGGIGLGLTIASQLVGLMQGRLWVESEPGRGSLFHFTARFGRAAAAEHAVDARRADLRGVPVLVADDNPINRKLLESRLLAWGMKPDLVDDGRQALLALSRASRAGTPYPVAILDVQMPGLDGFSVADEVKGHPELRATRLLLLTSAGQRGDAARCQEIGLEGYLTKPAREAELCEALASILAAPPHGEGESLVTRHTLRETPRSPIVVPESHTAGADSGFRGSLPVVDRTELLARVDGDHGLLADLVRAFMSTAPQQLASIDAALERGEGAALSRAAHTLKGSVGTFAAPGALKAAARVESCGLKGDLGAAREARRELGTEIDRLSQALLPYLSGRAA